MIELLNAIKDTSIPALLVGGGLIFLVLAIAGRVMGQVEVPPPQQRIAGIIGVLLLLSGIGMQLVPVLLPSRIVAEPTLAPLPTAVPLPPAPPAQPTAEAALQPTALLLQPTVAPPAPKEPAPPTAAPAPSEREAPEASLRAYWQAVSAQRYADAWPMLSANFRWTTHENDFDAYVRGYAEQALCSVEPQGIVVEATDSDYARLTATLIYRKGGDCAPAPLGLIFHMAPAADRPIWLIDRVALQ